MRLNGTTSTGEKVLARMAAARRKAESLTPPKKKEAGSSLRAEQELERRAMSAKIARLREARLAKEAEDREAGVAAVKPKAARKRARPS